MIAKEFPGKRFTVILTEKLANKIYRCARRQAQIAGGQDSLNRAHACNLLCNDLLKESNAGYVTVDLTAYECNLAVDVLMIENAGRKANLQALDSFKSAFEAGSDKLEVPVLVA